MSIRMDLYHYRRNKRKIRSLKDKILFLRTKAAKVTPTYAGDECRGSGDGNRVEDCIIKIIETEKRLKLIQARIDRADAFLSRLKPYQRYIVWLNLVDHIPYPDIAEQEKTSVPNIRKIIERSLPKVKPPE